jgi:hypothetical protein
MSAMSITAILRATILRAADVNDVRDYFHYSDRLKCARGYNDVCSHYCCGLL